MHYVRFSLLIRSFYAKPRSIPGWVQILPKKLPTEQFKEAWNKFSPTEQNKLWKNAQNRASKILNKHKTKTGRTVTPMAGCLSGPAILGHVNPVLSN